MKKIIIPVVILVAFVVIPMLALNFIEKEYKNKPRNVPAKHETGQAFADKVRIQGGEHMVRFGSEKIAELLPKYERDKKNLDILADLVHHYNSIAKGYKQLYKNEKAKEPRAKSLKYLTEYEQAMEKAWSKSSLSIADDNFRKIINFFHHIKVNYFAVNKWNERYIKVWQDRWDAGQQTYEVAYWLYHLNTSWSSTYLYKINKSITGRTTGIAPNTLEIDKWKKIIQKMSQEGKKPKGWSMPHYY